MAFSNLLGGLGRFAAANPLMTGIGGGALLGGLIKGRKGAMLGAGLGGLAGAGGLFSPESTNTDAVAGATSATTAPVAQGGLQELLRGLTLKDVGAGLKGAGDIYSTYKGSEQAQELIDMQNRIAEAGLLESERERQRRSQAERNISAGFNSNYYGV